MARRPHKAGTSRRSVLSLLLGGACGLALPFRAAAESGALGEALDRALDRGFGERSGAGVVVEVASGKILATKNLTAASQRLALPGSTLKTFTLIALLESGKLRPDETYVCPYGLKVGGHHLDCPHPTNLGPMDPAQALAYSCNNFFARMGLRLTPQELQQALAGWGFSSPTHLVPGEATGTVVLARSQNEQELQAIGEFGIHVTPLELLQAFRRLAQHRRDSALTPALRTTFEGMEAGAVYGMAAAAKTEGLVVAGKTGTALAEEGNWTHGWFSGYAPADAPEIVLVVFLERGRGPADAAGIGHDLFTAYRDARGG